MAIKITQNTLIGAGQIVTIDNPEVDSFNYWLTPDRPGFLYEGSTMPTPQFLNAGTITITLAAAPGLDPPGQLVGFGIARTSGTDSSSLFHNQESGIFRVISLLDIGPFGATKGFFAPQQSIAFLNDGLFEVRALSFYTTGVETYDSSSRFTNTGILRVEGAHYAEGAYINNGGMVRNSGLIDVAGGSGAVGVYFGAYVPGPFSDGKPSFVNDGTIRAISSDEPSFGVYVAISLYGGTYINTGVIEADYAFWINPGGGYASTIRSSETLINHGEIRGDIGLAYGADVLQNHGTIYGYTDLGEGNDVYEGASGFHYGLIAAGTGDDQVTGGDGGETIYGEEGRDSINAGGGDDFVDGGRGSDSLDGGAGYDTLSYLDSIGAVSIDLAAGFANGADQDRIRNFEAVIGSSQADTITGSGEAEFLEGAGGDDTISGGGGGDDILGDAGNDLLTGGGGDDLFHFSIGDGHDTLSDFTPGGGEDSLIVYGYSAAAGIVQIGADTLITLSGGDSILLKNVQAGSLTAADLVFDPVPLAPSPIPNVASAQVVNSDFVIQAGERFEFTNPLPLAINDQLFENAGLVTDGLSGLPLPSVWVAGVLDLESSAATGDVTGISSAIADGPTSGETNTIILGTGLVEVTATGGANARGVIVSSHFWNAGRLHVQSTGGAAIGAFTEQNQFTNAGLIQVSAGTSATGVFDRNAKDLWNSGDIIVSGGSASTGIRMEGYIHPAHTAGSLVNSGTVRVTDSTPGEDSVALSLGLAGNAVMVWNLGLIEADFAIRRYQAFFPEPGDQLTIYNLGTVRGRVELGPGDTWIHNQGLIEGRITLGTGADVYDGRGGTQEGGIFGEDGADRLIGGTASETLDGGADNDLISGGGGSDMLTGGGGNDVFHFEAGFGSDVITDFVAGGSEDVLEINGYAAPSTIQQEGADTRIIFSAADSILLKNVIASSLTPGDFQFSAAALAAPLAIPGAPAMPAAPPPPSLTPAAPPPFIDSTQDVPLSLTGTSNADELRGAGRNDSISGGDGADLLMGYAGNDLILGEGGDDQLFGGAGDDDLDGGPGADRMRGGAGDDNFAVDSALDRVIEYDGEGVDAVFTALAAYALPDQVEILVGESQAGQALTGNALDNLIIGGGGNDIIGTGGGADTIYAGAGDDVVTAGAGDDVIDAGAGADRIVYADIGDSMEASGDLILGFQSGIDKIDLTAIAELRSISWTVQTDPADNSLYNLVSVVTMTGTMSIRVKGQIAESDFLHGPFVNVVTEGDDTINGTSGPDTFNGLGGNDTINGLGANDDIDGGPGNDLIDGGAGADAMTGGLGDDIFIVDGAGDSITELAGGGTDEIRTALASYSLSALANVEKLTGLGAIDQTLTGNGGDNIIDGGLGADTMTGGLGNDIYIVDNGGDVAVELAGEGSDEIRTAMAVYSIGALANVENLTATSNINHDFRGNGGNNVVTGAGGNDFIRLQDGGVDTAVGAGGNDVFLFGATLTSADSVDGGIGLDQVAIQGDYSGGLTLGSGFVSIESFAILPGSDTRFGDTAGNFYSYNLTTLNSNVAPGVLMIIDANRLRVGENFTFNGSAETDGNFFLYGGGGTDTLLGGSNNDTFYFGENGQFGATDHVDGGVSGTDQLGLRGSYTIAFGANQLTSIESIGLVSAQDTRFGALGTSYNYNLTMNDGNLAAGVRMTVDAAPLRPSETLTFNGSAELDGWFRIFGGQGSDTITGSQTGDIISGGLGSDNLRGAGGADTFLYRSVADSLLSQRDSILDFGAGDRIDLSQIDAVSGTPGNDAFTFIGSAAFSGAAGELRASFYAGNGLWTVSGDVNGDGTADIEFYVTSDHPILGTDFVL